MPPDWPALITAARSEVPSPLLARRYDGAPGVGVSQTQYFTCTDGNTYVVKLKGNADGSRALATEQVVAYLGQYLGAPIPPAPHVLVESELRTSSSRSTTRGSFQAAPAGQVRHWPPRARRSSIRRSSHSGSIRACSARHSRGSKPCGQGRSPRRWPECTMSGMWMMLISPRSLCFFTPVST